MGEQVLEKSLTSEQYYASSCCNTFLSSDVFRLTVVDFLKEFYKLTLNSSLLSLLTEMSEENKITNQ